MRGARMQPGNRPHSTSISSSRDAVFSRASACGLLTTLFIVISFIYLPQASNSLFGLRRKSTARIAVAKQGWCKAPQQTLHSVKHHLRGVDIGAMSSADNSSKPNDGFVESYSIWLQPAPGPTAEKLQREIDTQSRQLGTPPFAAHVTLLPDIKRPQAEAVTLTEDLARQLKRYRLNFLNVSQGSTFHRSVYILCVKDAPTLDAAALSRTVFDMPAPEAYMPHLSLVYGDLDPATCAASVQTAIKRLYGEGSSYDTLLVETGFEVQTLSLWYTPVEDRTLASWCKVAEVPLI